MAGREYVSKFQLVVDPEEQRRRDAIAQGIVQDELTTAIDAGDARSASHLQQELKNRFSGKTGVAPTFTETPAFAGETSAPSSTPDGWTVIDPGWTRKKPQAATPSGWEDVSSQFYYAGAQPKEQQPDDSFTGSMARGIKKTIPELKQAGAGAIAYLGDVFGAEGVKEWGLNKYHEIEDSTKNLQSANDSFSKVVLDGEGSFKAWLGNAVGYSIGQVGLALVSGGVGAIGGKMIAKQGLTKLVEGEIAKSFEKNVAAGMAEEAAKAAAIKTGQEFAAGALVAGRNTGAFTGALLHNETQELGSIYNDAVEQAKKEGRTLDGGDLFRIGASSLAAAGVDTAMEAVNFNKLTKGGIGSTLAKRAAVEIPSGMAREGVTESVQTGIEQYGAGKPLDTREIIDSAALGAVGGGMAGGGAALRQRQAPTASDAQTIEQAATLPVTPVVSPEDVLAIQPQSLPIPLSPREQRQQAVADKLYPLPTQRETAPTADRQLEAINAINPLPEQRDGTIGVRQTPFTDAEIAAGVERAQAPARAIEEAYRLNEREQQDAAFQQGQQPQGKTPLAFNEAAAAGGDDKRRLATVGGAPDAPQVTLRANGQPFATLKAAETSIKARGLSGAVAVSVKGGGFGIRMAAPASAPINVGQANEPANQRIASTVRDDGIQGNIAPTPNAPTQPQPSAQGGSAPTFAGNAMAAGLRDGSGTNLVDAGKPQSDGAGVAPAPLQDAPVVAPTDNERSAFSQREPASWVIREKATGAVIMETFDKKKVAALNTTKYEAVPILEHLAGLNKKPTEQAVNEGAPQIEALTDDDLEFAASDKPDTPQSLRDGMASLGFTQQEIDDEVTARFGQAQASAQSVAEPTASTAQSTGTSGTQAPPAAEVTKTGDDRARDAELFRKTKSRLIAAFTGKSGESFDDLSKTLTARANDKNDPQSKLAAEVLDNFDGWRGNYEQRQEWERKNEARPALDLTNPTESKLRTDDAKQKRDAAEKAAKENAPSPEEFGLVGSNRAADVGAAAGQKDLLAEKPAEKRKTDKTTAVYEALLKKKSTRLLKDHGNGRILYDVTITPEFRNANFVHGRMPRADGFELRDKADITGNPFDKGYVLIDNREQLRARGEPLFSRASGKNAGMANDKTVVGNTTGRSADDGKEGGARSAINALSDRAGYEGVQRTATPERPVKVEPASMYGAAASKAKRSTFDQVVKDFAESIQINHSENESEVQRIAGEISADWSNGNVDEHTRTDGPAEAFAAMEKEKGDYYDADGDLTEAGSKRFTELTDTHAQRLAADIVGPAERRAVDLTDPRDAASVLHAYLNTNGVDTNVVGGSGKSRSKYFTILKTGEELRISDHELPGHYENNASIDLLIPSDPDEARAYLKNAADNIIGRLANEPTTSQDGDVALSRADTITIDGQQRPRNNSNGKPIAATDEGIRNFWRWFAGSRVVDERGRPLVVYHGTAKDFSKFDENFLYSGEGASQTGSGFYFTDNPESASGYSGQKDGSVVMPIYLSLQNPLSIDFALGEMQGADLKLTKALTRNVIMQAPNIRNVEESPLLNFGDIAYEGFNKVLQQAIDMYVGGNNIAALRNDFFGNDNAAWLTAFAKATGYDSAKTVTGIGDRHFVAWKPNQVKSALGNTGQFSPDNADIRFSREAPLWRSTLTEAIGKTSFAQAPADQWKAWLNANAAKLGVKKDEIEWSGVTDWLDLQKGKVTRDQVREFLDANGVKVTETMLADGEYEPTFVEQDDDGMWRVYGERANEGDVYDTAEQANAKSEEYNADIPAGPSKYSSYQLPGGTNYRELLLTLPTRDQAATEADAETRRIREEGGRAYRGETNKSDFKSSHWDQPNILAHIRFNERTDADGKRVLFIEEIQSDWGQEGKKKGFARSKEAIQIEFDKVRQQYLDTPRSSPSFAAIEQRMGELRNENGNGTPSAPFVGKTEAWVSLALKRMIRYAIDNGFDRIAMVNGEQSAERYDLSKQVDSITVPMVNADSRSVRITPTGGSPIKLMVDNKGIVDGYGQSSTQFSGKPLDEIIGKGLADKVMAAQAGDVLSGDGLKVGGEGMKAFYDKIVPQVANDVLKKLGGGKVGTIEIGKGGWDVYRTDERTDEPELVRANVKTEALANDIASDYLGGHVKRAQGQQPGFDITDKMREHAAQGMPLFRRDEQQPATTNTHAADVIAKAAKTVNIPLDVYATPQEASAKLGIYIPSDVRGLHYRGRAALISSNITTPAMGEFVLWHELFHAGITLIAPRYSNEYNRIMQDMAARNSNIIKAARDWRNSYGAETIKRSMDAGLSQEQAEKRMRLMAIEEAIADLAGANVELKGWQQFVAKLQALLRSMGFDNLANWIEGKSNAEVLQLIARTREEVTTQNLHLTTQVPAFAREEDDASYQRAYHGTPHKFDKFSLDKIGTGEGAQAYGYGLYFASKKEIAEFYRDALTSKNVRPSQLVSLSGTPLSELMADAPPAARAKVTSHIQSANGDMKAAKTSLDAFVDEWAEKATPKGKSDLLAAKEWMRKLANESATFTPKPTGALYQVDIPEDSEMLHWDKPLSEQSDEVKALANKYDYPLSRTGGDFQKWASSASGGLTINIRGPKDRAGLEKQASDLFKKNGIRGIKYLDGGSRNAGDGSYNYVVFDDKDVNIEAVHSRADTIEVDGKARARSNSNGKPIATTDEGLRNFWKWFGDSKAVDAYGKPLVVYHGAPDARFVNQDGTFKTLGERYGGNEPDKRAFWFSKDRRTASTYADDRRAFDYQNAEAGVVDAYIRLENPLIVDANGDYWRTAQRRGKTSDVIAEARAAGNDGAIVRDVKDEYNNIKGTASTTTYTVFSSNQIKSAVGNTGAFSPDNADIRFSRNEQTTSQDGDVAFSRSGSGDIFDKNATDAQSTYNGTEAVQGIGASVKNVIRQTANIARDKRGAALSFLGGRQIADIYSKDVPELPRYNEILQRMQAEQNEGSAVADSIIEKWRVINRKRPDVATQLSSLMHDSTLAQVDPDVSADNAELRKRWINLPQEAKDIYREARDAYVAHFEKVKAELIDRVERSALDTSAKNRTLASMREEFTKAMKGVYFPLARFGDYMVVVKDKAGVTQSVSMAETTNQAQALRAELLRAYPDYVVGAIQKKKEFNAERDGVSRGFMKDLVALINEEPDAQTRDSQLDAINQLWLSSLPDLSWAKSGIHRKGTPGYSNDAMRAFARNMFHGGYHLAKLRYGDRLGDTLAQMQETIDNKVRSNPEYSNVVAQSVVDEMNARHKHVMNPQNTPVANALTGLGFMWHMGLSPASAVVNLSQTALVAYPMLASKFGFGKAATMLLSLSADAVKGKNDLLSQLQGAEKDAYDRAVREGLIDITMAHDLAGVSQGKSGEFNEKQQRVMRVASVMFHEAEKFNRGVTFMSAYRLAVQSGVSDPYKLAHDLTFDSHFDYSSQNRPRVMQGPTARVVLLFKQYGQNMIYTLSRNTFKALQGDREAQKTLAGLLAMHGMFAGALGLPLMTTLLAAASAIGGSDDEPWDAQVALRNYLADAFGKDIGEVLAHGVFRAPGIKDAIGADISGRVGLDSMLIRMPQETLEGKKYYQALLETIAGPVFGIGGNIANGMQTMAQGNTLRGIEEMLPKSIKDPLKAYRYEQDGIQDKTGITIVDETTIPEEVAQFLGFSPARGMEGFEGKSAIKNQEALLTQRRRQLMQRYGKDAEEGDTADSLVAIQRWNIANPTMAIKGQDLLRSMREKAKRQAEAENGAYLSKKRRGLAELGEFANAE